MAQTSDPIIINKTKIKNRLTMAPTVKFDYAGADGKVTGASSMRANSNAGYFGKKEMAML